MRKLESIRFARQQVWQNDEKRVFNKPAIAPGQCLPLEVTEMSSNDDFRFHEIAMFSFDAHLIPDFIKRNLSL